MKMTIRTKRKYGLYHSLQNNNKYELVAIIRNDFTRSKISVVVKMGDSVDTFDSKFFRMNSIKIKKL